MAINNKSTFHIIGAGLAGLSAAIRLLPHGRVVLYESAAQAGGRCRSYYDSLLEREIDNGNHLVLSANREVMDYLKQIGSRDSLQPIGSRYNFMDIVSGEHWTSRLDFRLMRCLFGHRGRTVSQCFNPQSRFYRRVITPLCLAALNTAPEEASATMLAQTVKRLALSGPFAGRGWIPKENLQSSFIAPAIRTIVQSGGEILYHARLKTLSFHDAQIASLLFDGNAVTVASNDTVILATPAPVTAQLLPGITVPDQFEPIVNGHFCFAHGLPTGILGLTGTAADWLFIRSGMVSTTTSAASRLETLDHSTLASLLWRDICTALKQDLPLPPHRILIEKRATFRATEAQIARRPQQTTAYANLFLAGDYTASPLPATMEAAIASGRKAAQLALKCTAIEST